MGVSLSDELSLRLAEATDAPGFAIVSGIDAVVIASVLGGRLVVPPGRALPARPFEVRAGLGDREVRWVAPDLLATVVPEADAPRRHRLLLGTVVGVEDDWVRLRAARAADTMVPLAALDGAVPGRDDRLAFVVRVRLTEDGHGNVHVRDEVLTGLEVV